MKHAINTYLWTIHFDETNIDLLDLIQEWGYDGLEIARFELDNLPTKKIRQELEKRDLGCVFCSSLTGELSLIDEDKDIRRKAIAFIKQAIEIASELGAKILAGPMISPVGYITGRGYNQDEWQRAVESLSSLTETLERHDVTLALEMLNRFETYFMNTIADGAKLCNEIDSSRIGLLVDTFHSNIEERDLGAAIRQGGKHIKHFQAIANDRGAPGSGSIDWDGVYSALAAINYDGWSAIETFSASIPELASRAYIWRPVASSNEALATEGLAFMKQQEAKHGTALVN